MDKLQAYSPLAGLEKTYEGLSLKEIVSYELVALSQAMDEEKTFKAAFKKQFGKTPPLPLELKSVKGGYAFWSGQSQYMLLIEGENINADQHIAKLFNGSGYAALQTDGWAHVALSGPRVLDVFERFLPLDIQSFKVGQATRTHAHHMAVMVLRMDENDYRLLTPRSSCVAFIEGLEHVIEHVISSKKV